MVKWSGIGVLLLLAGCNSSEPPVLLDSLITLTEENKPVYDVAYTDLNADGKNEAIVFLKGKNWCGSGGCTMMVLEPKSDYYQLVSQTTVTQMPIRVTSSEQDGWKDLLVYAKGEGDVVLSFSGESYPQNASLAPKASEQQIKQSRILLN